MLHQYLGSIILYESDEPTLLATDGPVEIKRILTDPLAVPEALRIILLAFLCKYRVLQPPFITRQRNTDGMAPLCCKNRFLHLGDLFIGTHN